MANPTALTVTSSISAVVAPADCLAVNVQLAQGSQIQPNTFKLYAADGTTLISTNQGGADVQISAPQGLKFTAGQTVGYLTVPSSSYTFSVFADPVVGGAVLPDSLSRFATVVLTSAQLLAMQTTAIQLVPAPGPGRAVIPRKLVLIYRYGATAYTIGNADNTIRLEYVGKTTVLIAPAATGLVDQTANTVISQSPAVALAAIAQSNMENLGLEVKVVGTTPALTLGDGTVIATIIYDNLPLAA